MVLILIINCHIPEGINQRRGRIIKGPHSGHGDGKSMAQELAERVPISPYRGFRGHCTDWIRSRGPMHNK